MKLSKECYCLRGLTHADYFSVNAGFIVGKNETIIIDSGFNEETAETIFGYATAVAPENKISYVINLEGHYDHIFGNTFLKEKGVKIVAHELVSLNEKEIDDYVNECNDEISIERRKKNKEAFLYFHGIKAFEPDIKINKNIDFLIDGLTLKIYTAYGHTDTNIMVYESKDKIIYVAVTIYSGYLSTLNFGNKKLWNMWLETLDLIESLEPLILIPGHGQVLYNDDIYKEIKRHRELIIDRINNS